jgi:hypothetical protein
MPSFLPCLLNILAFRLCLYLTSHVSFSGNVLDISLEVLYLQGETLIADLGLSFLGGEGVTGDEDGDEDGG